MHRYKVFNAAMPTTAAIARVTTGTSIKTMLQIATPAARQCQLISWGYTLDGVPGSTGGAIELIQTDVGATIIQHVASGIQPLDPNAPPSLMDISGVTKTGYSASAEGSITAVRTFDTDLIPPTAGAADVNYDYQWLPDERPIVGVSKFLRVRATFAAAVNMLCWVCFDE